MKTIFLSLSLVLSLALLACSTTKNISENSNNVEQTIKDRDSSDVFASIYRSACFGSCTTYKMTIYQDGFISYEGIRFVELEGKYHTTITKEQMQSFIDKAESIGYFEMEDKYDSSITDIPSVTTSIKIKNKQKEVYARVNYPKRLVSFFELFDRLIESEEWVKDEVN